MKWPCLCRLIEETESRMIRNVFFSFTKSNCMMLVHLSEVTGSGTGEYTSH